MNKKKPAGRPKLNVHEVLDISGLHMDWDSSSELRDRLRDGGSLLEGEHGEDIPSTLKNVLVLQPLITRMSLTETKPLPVIDTLRDEVERIYVKNKRQNAPETAPDVVALSWRIRKLLGFLKMKCRRREVSGAPLLH